MDWRHHAACRDQQPETFFPLSPRQVAEAKAVCRRCPVRPECLDWALKHEDHGVWGGLDEVERRALRKQQAHRPAA